MKHEELLEHIQQAVDTCFEYELVPYKDGNQWCVLYGENIQDGIVGFGDTRLDAMLEFKKEYDSYVKRTHLYPTKEQPVEGLEEEIKRWIHAQRNNGRKLFGWIDMVELAARHFYDLGCSRTAEMYDEIEYNRQRAEETKISKGLEEEISSYIESHYHIRYDETLERGSSPLTTFDFGDIARHFAEWGAEHLKK